MSMRLTLAPGWLDALARESHAVRLAEIKKAEAAAVRLCPVRTGALARTVEGEADDASLAMRLSAGDGQVDYAKYVELGTRRMAAQPYLRPAIQEIGR